MSKKQVQLVGAGAVVLAALITGVFMLLDDAAPRNVTSGDSSPIIQGNNGTISIGVPAGQSKEN